MLRSNFFRVLCLLLSLACLPLFSEQTQENKQTHHKFVVHAIPKCGTHFIQRIISLMTGEGIFNGDLSEKNLLKSEENGKILRAFSPWRHDRISLLKKHHTKLVAMVRDPRDALISNLFYMRQKAGKGVNRDVFAVVENFDDLSLEDQLTSLIRGDKKTQPYLEFYRDRMGFSLDPYCLTLKYEDLVGKEGGGSDELQRKAVIKLADYLGLALSDQKLQQILDNMYDKKEDVPVDGAVFIRASIGNWKTFLTPYHKKLFKKRFKKELVQLGYEKDDKW